MNTILNGIVNRRSIRKYKTEQITDEELNIILSAAEYAPSAGSRQSPLIVVCQDEEINIELGKINKAVFKGRISDGNTFVSREQPSIADDVSIISGFYGAPTVITLFAPKKFLYSIHDCCVMAENIMLTAHFIGVGSCLIARAEDTFSSELGKKLQKEWGIDETYEAKIHIALGYNAAEAPTAKPRKENRIIKVKAL